MMEAKDLVSAWATAWPGGPTPAAVSALDVLVGDVLEEEEGTRPDAPVVTLDGTHRIDGAALDAWTIGWPGRAGWFERLTRRKQARLLRRLLSDRSLAPERIAVWTRTAGELGEIPWASIADMEVVSLALGHFGPARQPAALPVVASFLVGVAATFAGASVERLALAVPAAASVLAYEPSFAKIARTSAHAIEELARRARERGHALPDPFARPIPSYLPLLGGALV